MILVWKIFEVAGAFCGIKSTLNIITKGRDLCVTLTGGCFGSFLERARLARSPVELGH